MPPFYVRLCASSWGAPVQVPTKEFSDQMGRLVWGEPTLDATQTFMLFVRFNTTDATCWDTGIMYTNGNFIKGYAKPVKLN